MIFRCLIEEPDGKDSEGRQGCWENLSLMKDRLATACTIRGSNPGGGEIFRTFLERPWRPPRFLYNGYRVSLPGGKRPRCGLNHPLPSNAEVEERVELYLYFPTVPSWPVLGWTLLMKTIRNIEGCWDEVLQTFINSVWRRLYSDVL